VLCCVVFCAWSGVDPSLLLEGSIVASEKDMTLTFEPLSHKSQR